MISLRCASSPSPPCEWRRSRGGVSFGSYGISGFGCLSPGPTRSPVSPLAGNIDSLAGQVALGRPGFVYEMVPMHFISGMCVPNQSSP